ncbi:MAG TPA: hypothetical protein ENK06_04520, partial [Gammaproteobacteria bacterium]|nr:hypothetical protein [Gammaproteobacteria bacterium]
MQNKPYPQQPQMGPRGQHGQQHAGPNGSRPLLEYWHIILRHKWAILSITLLCTIIGFFIAASKTPIFQANSRLLIVPETHQLLFSDDSIKGGKQLNAFYRTQVEIIHSRSLAAEVIKELNLASHIDYLPEKSGFIGSLSKLDENGAPVKAEKLALHNIDTLVSMFKTHMTASSERNSEVVGIRYEGKDPVMTAKIVNKVVEVYIKRVELAQRQSNSETVQWLSENLEIARQKLVESEAELQSYQNKENIGDSENEDRIQSGKYGNIMSKLLAARTKRAEYEIRLQQVKSLPRKIEAYQNLQYVLNNTSVQRLNEKRDQIAQEILVLSERYGKKHPKIIAAKRELQSAIDRVHQEIFRVVNSIQKDYELAVAQEKEVGKIYNQMQEEDRSQKGARFNLAKLEREVETNKELYNMLLTKLKEADIARNKGKINIKV